jgi:hypothetical protein
MKKIISIVAIFALLASFADLAMAKRYNKKNNQRGGVIRDTGQLGSDAVVGTGRVVDGAATNTGRVIRDIF